MFEPNLSTISRPCEHPSFASIGLSRMPSLGDSNFPSKARNTRKRQRPMLSPSPQQQQKKKSRGGVGRSTKGLKPSPRVSHRLDRFIPLRLGASGTTNADVYAIGQEYMMDSAKNDTPTRTFHAALKDSLLSGNQEAGGKASKILSFMDRGKLGSTHRPETFPKAPKIRKPRYISKNADRILDAPDMRDNFCSNVLDWGQNNVLAVGLGSSIFLWNSYTGSIDELCNTNDPDDLINCVKWTPSRDLISISTTKGNISFWDVERKKRHRRIRGHMAEGGNVNTANAMDWNDGIFTIGCQSGEIITHDVRLKNSETERLEAHRSDVISLKWSPNRAYLASSSSDHTVCIWDRMGKANQPPRRLQHQTPVRAVAWCPWSSVGMLATGACSDGQTTSVSNLVRFWEGSTGELLDSVDVQEPVCNLLWNPHAREFVTTHGIQNELRLWKYSSKTKTHTLTGHTEAVIHAALGLNGTTLCTGSGDETLRFWKVFEPTKRKKQERRSRVLTSIIR